MLDMAQLRNITLNDESLMREIVAALVEDTGAQIARLRDAISHGKALDCARLAHSARGACGNVGATLLAEVLAETEAAARAGDVKLCATYLSRLDGELDKLREYAARI
ncbi:MAG: Hpt domain-containing protein [Bryobacterales bacterium]|nr:Hpt domain-containing protein [Bryobacterales bacterium]